MSLKIHKYQNTFIHSYIPTCIILFYNKKKLNAALTRTPKFYLYSFVHDAQ